MTICGYFSCYFSVPHTVREGLGVPWQLGGDTASTADPSWPKSFLYHMAPHSAIKAEEEKERGGGEQELRHLEWQCLSSQETVMCNESCFPRSREHLPADRKLQMIFLFCFVCTSRFCHSSQSIFISTHEFSYFYTSDCLLHTTWGEWTLWNSAACWVKSQCVCRKVPCCTNSFLFISEKTSEFLWNHSSTKSLDLLSPYARGFFSFNFC